ncbi:MAG: ribosomal protein S18-alanine N-acetyltransferase [Kofleriaceae bacterium]
MDLRVTPASLADLEELDLLERSSFQRPWAREAFVAELARPFARVDVARLAGRAVGYLNYWLVADEASLLSIAVHPDHRQRGVATRMVAHLLAQARAAGAALVTLEVRRGNAPAIALYERHGFGTAYVRRGYYPDGEDAVVMELALAAT